MPHPLPLSPTVEPQAATGSVPIARPLLPDASQILPYLERIDGARHYSNFGPLVRELEARLAARSPGVNVCTVVNATQGISLLLRAAAPQGGLCLVPGFTFVATAHAALEAGLAPLLIDVDPDSWMLTPAAAARAIAEAKTPVAAVVVVAAFGAMPDLEGFAHLQHDTGVPVILDAAAAFDTLGPCPLPAAVSLHATKVLGAGEGGYVVGDDALIAQVRALSSFGFSGDRRSHQPATNAKMSEYSAAVALASLDGWDVARRRWMLAARKLRLAAAGRDIAFQPGWGEDWVSSTCVIQTAEGGAAALRDRLTGQGVESRHWWGAGLHREPAFETCPRTALPVVEMLAASTLGLPFAIDLAGEEIAAIGRAIG